ncbi:hypothetical protein QTU60_001678, partial [Campylobacter upsaliensis]|nr:hypothetical protein [Campylobacter upsaliensis]
KTWLTYRLGRVLLECDRDKLKGGYFKFFSKIKQAKKEFKALKESRVYRLKDKLKFKNEEDFDLFIKNYALIENLLTHYEALNEVIVSNMAFVLEHFDEVSLWLNSQEFKEKYKSINHPYPPLLNPDKLNDENYILNYEKIPANLAWEMNLPLPKKIKIILNYKICAGSGMLEKLFARTFSNPINNIWDRTMWSSSGVYKNYYQKIVSNLTQVMTIQAQVKDENLTKLSYLVDHHIPVVSVVRDPFEILTTWAKS